MTRIPDARSTTGGTTAPFTARRHPDSRPFVVALDDEDVRDPLDAAPGNRGLGSERAPTRDYDDRGSGVGQRPNDPGRERVVVVYHLLRAGET